MKPTIIREPAKETLDLLLGDGPSIGCALAMTMIKVSSKKSDRPATAQVGDSAEQIAFGCSIAVPTNKE